MSTTISAYILEKVKADLDFDNYIRKLKEAICKLSEDQTSFFQRIRFFSFSEVFFEFNGKKKLIGDFDLWSIKEGSVSFVVSKELWGLSEKVDELKNTIKMIESLISDKNCTEIRNFANTIPALKPYVQYAIKKDKEAKEEKAQHYRKVYTDILEFLGPSATG